MKEFENFMKREKMEKLMQSPAERFEELLKKSGLENITGKEGYKFIVYGKNEGDVQFMVLAEFDTVDEARDWYDSLGQIVTDEGGELAMNYGPSESRKNEEEK